VTAASRNAVTSFSPATPHSPRKTAGARLAFTPLAHSILSSCRQTTTARKTRPHVKERSMRPIPHRTTFIGITLALTTIVAVLAAATTPGGASRPLAAMPAAAARMSGSSIPLLFEPSTRH
jgi:hypothetical protein